MSANKGTLARKFRKWMKFLKLDGWDVKIGFKDLGVDTAAEVSYCSPIEKFAVIDVAKDLDKFEGYKMSFNLDTLIIHELMHVLMWEQVERLPGKVKNCKDFKEFEEFLCSHFAKIIFDIKERRTKCRPTSSS